MIESLTRNEDFTYQKLKPEEMKARGILGRLVGPCADFINPTRNGRKYSEELWERVFEDPIMKERIESGVCFGELGHPADREETDMEKIAVCLREQPKKNKEGQLVAVFDILDTPNGRILKTLCDYGSKIGVSSRGTGDLIGDEVDPETYDCQGWDVVLIPAVKAARMEYVTESLDTKNTKLKQALCESLNNATEEERKIMTETLNNLHINLNEEKEECISENCTDKLDETSNETIVTEVKADDDGLAVMKSLQEALKDKSTLEAQVRELQEKLAVSNAKVDEVSEDAKKYKAAMKLLTTEAKKVKDLSSKVTTLEESLKEKNERLQSQADEFKKVIENTSKNESKKLEESISSKDAEINKLNESIKSLNQTKETEVKKLQEALEAEKHNSQKTIEELKLKLQKQSNLKEAYKKLANSTVNKYIESKATMLGITANEIKNRLAESYTVEDIDKVCEDLQAYALNMSKLPIAFSKNAKFKVTESKNESLRVNVNADDEIDDSLIGLAKTYIN